MSQPAPATLAGRRREASRAIPAARAPSPAGIIPCVAASDSPHLVAIARPEFSQLTDRAAPSAPAPAVVYDFGMNNGDDVEYYLKKARLVVGVDANPQLCRACAERFQAAVTSGRLVIVNGVLTEGDDATPVSFWIHNTNHVLSQMPRPPEARLRDFHEVMVPVVSPTRLVQRYGQPLYIKIDLEGYEAVILRHLFANDIRPKFISAEIHSAETVAAILNAGYRSYNLVEGIDVPVAYADHPIATLDGPAMHNFPMHSAGPFGEDLRTPWRSADAIFTDLRRTGLGWRDLHAAADIPPAPAAPTNPRLLYDHECTFQMAARQVLRRSRAMRIIYGRWRGVADGVRRFF